MIEDTDSRPATKSDTTLRLLVLGVIYTVAVFFVVALSPSMGFVTPRGTAEIGNVAAAPEPAAR